MCSVILTKRPIVIEVVCRVTQTGRASRRLSYVYFPYLYLTLCSNCYLYHSLAWEFYEPFLHNLLPCRRIIHFNPVKLLYLILFRTDCSEVNFFKRFLGLNLIYDFVSLIRYLIYFIDVLSRRVR